MLKILVKTIVNTNNNTANTNDTNTCDNTFNCLLTADHRKKLTLLNVIKLTERLLSRNRKITIVYNDMMLMRKHCSNI